MGAAAALGRATTQTAQPDSVTWRSRLQTIKLTVTEHALPQASSAGHGAAGHPAPAPRAAEPQEP